MKLFTLNTENKDITLRLGDNAKENHILIDDADPNANCRSSLAGRNLSNVDFSGVNLSGWNMSNANIVSANLTNANLYGANLIGADLTGADLTGADLSRADLYGATSDSTTTWPTAEYWNSTACPNGSNSHDQGNATCGF